MRSPRQWFPLLGWCAATLTSVALASVAMLPVLRTATADESALGSVEQLRDSGAVAPVPVPSATSGPAPSVPRSESPRSGRTPSPSESRSRTRKPTTAPPRPSSTPSAATTTEDGWTVTEDGDGDKTYVRSFRVDGGTTVIRMTEGKVELVTATPNDGFSVATVQNTPDNLAVYFNEVNHSFVIHAVWWADRNRPFAEISEIGK
ncbi:DNA mismatch repair protein MutL [Jidongwangia harbinensis]|uniref:DNA mismatch repair protein MutL n=1 Tax=Jidongwangia harbinensis TaxID=2878561 RepID=UPI001CDA1DEB|nr:DNA mismatch repair protein MutL [Jidongwangia harbinensis]MCA2218134.1 DNA mismatch repair protein MutL [Jidongwangia harbinensis]